MTATAAVKETPLIFTAESIRAILDGRKTQTRRVIAQQPKPCDHAVYEKHEGRSVPTEWVTFDDDGTWYCATCGNGVHAAGRDHTGIRCPYGVPGDRLWVKEAMFRSECGRYLALPGNRGAGNFEAWTADGSTHWLDDDRVKTWADQKKFRHPLAYVVGGYSAQTTGQKKGSFTLNLLHCDTTKEVEPFTGNTVIESRDIVFRRKTAFMPRWASRLALEITEVRVQRVQEISEEDAIAEGSQTPCAELPKSCRQAARSERQQFSRIWDSINANRGFPWAGNPWVWAISFKQVPR